jgi:hypothetical protein
MKITKSQLKRVIKEEIKRVLRENNAAGRRSAGTFALPVETVVTTSDGKKHKLKIIDIGSGTAGDPAWGGLDYEIDGEDFEWEFHTGYFAEYAAEHIIEKIDDEENEKLKSQLTVWLEKLNLQAVLDHSDNDPEPVWFGPDEDY